MSLPRLVVLISGSGTNLQALIDAVAADRLRATIVLVVSNKKTAYGLQRAAAAGIPTIIFPLKPFKDAGRTRIEYDIDLAQKILDVRPDLVVLAGWMHILSSQFLDRFPNNVMNLHPALPGEFDGAEAIHRAFDAFMEGKIKRTGVMVHKVIADVDRGEVILKEEVPIHEGDRLEDLETRIHVVEHRLIVAGAQKFLDELVA
ncbi:phosphoribosylglycinamide formyltransferase [Jimgerdemannia flammicorona]|uniref:Phosphoribosylglycinamide formyltransferase n=1 Tax=Jimgerdemannia flammicorona TaxID=994334 RepID=A0A433AQY2_9FUNG|nr:phosphoribosylglycinamide formyltransferase [Jimgerdemannia flammicorona]